MLLEFLIKLLKNYSCREIGNNCGEIEFDRETFWEILEEIVKKTCRIDNNRSLIDRIERPRAEIPIRRGSIVYSIVYFFEDMYDPVYVRVDSKEDIEEYRLNEENDEEDAIYEYEIIVRAFKENMYIRDLFNRTNEENNVILINDEVRNQEERGSSEKIEEIVIRSKRRPVILLEPIKENIWLSYPLQTMDEMSILLEELLNFIPFKFHLRDEQEWSKIILLPHLVFVKKESTEVYAYVNSCLLNLILQFGAVSFTPMLIDSFLFF